MRLTGSITRHMYLSTFDTHKKISDFPFVVINSMRWRRRLTKMALQHLFTRRLIQHISICRSRLQFTLRAMSSTGGSEPPEKKAKTDVIEHVNTSSDFVPRYNGPELEKMTPEQREIRDAILKSRPGTGLSGPFGPWLGVPEIAKPAQSLGRACRYGTSLSFRESELVILLTGAKTRAPAEFDIHVGEALKAGLPMEVIAAIPRDDAFSVAAVQDKVIPLLANEREVAIATYTAELLDTYSICDETYAKSKAAVDGKDSVLVEITSIAGYYTFVSYTLNAFRIPSKKK